MVVARPFTDFVLSAAATAVEPPAVDRVLLMMTVAGFRFSSSFDFDESPFSSIEFRSKSSFVCKNSALVFDAFSPMDRAFLGTWGLHFSGEGGGNAPPPSNSFLIALTLEPPFGRSETGLSSDEDDTRRFLGGSNTQEEDEEESIERQSLWSPSKRPSAESLLGSSFGFKVLKGGL